MSSAFLDLRSPESELLFGAMRELIAGTPGPALEAYEQAREADRAARSAAEASGEWLIEGDHARRRDGVEILTLEAAGVDRVMHPCARWVARIPAPFREARERKSGGLSRPPPPRWSQEREIRLESLMFEGSIGDAVREADRLLPLPAWWQRADAWSARRG